MRFELKNWNFNIKIPNGVETGCRYAVDESEIEDETVVYLEAVRDITLDDLVQTIDKVLFGDDIRTKKVKCYVTTKQGKYEFTVEYRKYGSMYGEYYEQIAEQLKL